MYAYQIIITAWKIAYQILIPPRDLLPAHSSSFAAALQRVSPLAKTLPHSHNTYTHTHTRAIACRASSASVSPSPSSSFVLRGVECHGPQPSGSFGFPRDLFGFLRYATLRYAMLRYATLCYAMLCYATGLSRDPHKFAAPSNI